MKCPHCNKEIEGVREDGPMMRWFMPNLILAIFVIGMLLNWVLPWNTKHGYAFDYDMLIAFGFIVVYGIYLGLYGFNKVKGNFVFIKKEKEKCLNAIVVSAVN